MCSSTSSAHPICNRSADRERVNPASMDHVLHTCRKHTLNGLDPEAYLRTLIARIADHPAKRIDELLPWNIKR
jgi:IS66 C-terminal element